MWPLSGLKVSSLQEGWPRIIQTIAKLNVTGYVQETFISTGKIKELNTDILIVVFNHFLPPTKDFVQTV